jgi:hypothetical protein
VATRIVSILLGSALLLGLASTAHAAATPECYMAEFWDRPGIERPHRLECERAWTVAVATAPAHGRLTGFAWDADAQVATWRFRPDAGAPAEDAMTLRLEGPNGTVTQRVPIHVTPRSQNTAPQCQPAEEARRTDGSAPAVVELYLSCWDYEHDSFTIDGGGPGEHLDGPRTVAGGDGGGTDAPLWHYRTATASGEEATSVWATDDLGARSADAALTVEVGPGVDRAPTCAPSPGIADGDHFAIFARPGATRRFGIVCADADHDPLTVKLGAKPTRGSLTTFAPAAQQDGERWVDAAYTPATSSSEPDPFSVVATAHGAATETKMAIAAPDQQRFISGLGCVTAAGRATAGSPGLIKVSCVDDEGDPLQATVTRAPAQGVAAAPSRTPAPYGWDDITVAWTPDPGFVGIDTLGLRVADGHGVQLDLAVNLYSYAAGTAPAAASPTLPVSGQPSAGQAKAASPLAQARAALGTRDVVLVRRIGDARVFARRAAVRRGLAARAGTTALAVTCPLRCRVQTAVKTGRARAAALGRATATPARAARLKLSRRAAGLLKASGTVAFELSARMPAGRSGRGVVRLRRR